VYGENTPYPIYSFTHTHIFMPIYRYKARDRIGELVIGKLEGADEAGIVANLDRLGYTVIEVTVEGKTSFSLKGFTENFKRIDRQEINIFTRQLATLIRAGLALTPSLDTICEQTVNKKFKILLEDIQQAVRRGVSFSEALSRHPKIFSELFVSMIEVGEAGGMLDVVLDRLAALGVQEQETTSRVKAALVYPVVLVVIALVVVNFMIIGVLPKFAMVFSASQAKLPLPTQIVLGLSWVMRKFWYVVIIVIGLIVIAFKGYISKPEGRFKVHVALLKLPIFGELYVKIQISRFARTLSALTSSGITLLQGLVVVEKTITNLVMRRAIQNIRLSITEGRSLVEQFKASGFFTPMVVQMVATGEKTGKLDKMLEEVAAFYEPEIEYTVKNLTTLLEPIMLLAMGIMVAFIALSVLLPIFKLMKVFRPT